MIAKLSGLLAEKMQEVLVVDVNGVGYEVNVTPRVSSSVGAEGGKVSLTIYTDVRENAIVLYGFTSQLERQTFLLLKKVKGIGSKIALSVLSSLSPEELMMAIGSSDIVALTRVSGIGKKGAERMIVELREQVVNLVREISSPLVDKIAVLQVESTYENVAGDAILAMEKLGFSSDRARLAVGEVVKNHPRINDAGDMVKQALVYLG